jgi:hypothetical protein
MGNSVGVFGFVWKRLEIFDLDGHNLGTFWFFTNPSPLSFSYKMTLGLYNNQGL